MTQKKLFIRTWGCQMNVYDSARMADVLATIGYGPTDRPEEADLILLNTCHIREKAADKVFSEIGRLRPLKAARPGLLIAVAGCVAQAEGAEIQARMPEVDVVLGPQAYHRLPEMVARAVRAGGGVLDTDFPAESKFDFLPDESAPRGPSAFLAVQEGCDKFCTYCVVPYTRGAEFSRPAAAILDEARRLVAEGSREINLLGQNVNAWRGDGPDSRTWTLARLIHALAEIDGLDRIRYTTSHPRDMSDDLIAAHGTVDKLMPWLHLPVQAGSDRILAAMNRDHTADDYRRTVDRLRAVRPDLALSGDFIVGFPGESEAEFRHTLDLVRDIGYASAYSFKFSARPGTPAAELADPVPDVTKSAWLAELQTELESQQSAFNRACVGRDFDVLLERPGRHPGQLVGRSPYMQAVHVQAPAHRLGQLVPVTVAALHAHSLAGVITPADSQARAGA